MTTTANKNQITQILRDKAPFGFIPTEPFYEAINVKRKKWAMLLRGEKEPTITEFKAICDYFKVDPKDFI